MHIDDGSKPLSGHAITITGWGVYKEIPYWICLNSWGIEWGTSGYTSYNDKLGLPYDRKGGGYFWFVRGINNCEFENNIVSGQPNLENITYPGTVSKYGWGLPNPDLNDVEFIGPINENSSIDEQIIDNQEKLQSKVEFLSGRILLFKNCLLSERCTTFKSDGSVETFIEAILDETKK